MSEEAKRGPGRPPGAPYPVKKQLRISEENEQALQALVEAWSRREGKNVSESEVVRRLIAEAAAEALTLGLLQARINELERRVQELEERGRWPDD